MKNIERAGHRNQQPLGSVLSQRAGTFNKQPQEGKLHHSMDMESDWSQS